MKAAKFLGIDPGSHRIGYGIVLKDGRNLSCGDYGTIEFPSGENKDGLVVLEREIEKLIRKNKPAAVAVEKLYFSKNRKTALAVAESRGVIILASKKSNIPVLEYDPTTVKQRITGYGLADKKAVLKMVRIFLGLKDFKGFDDASDALAIGIVAALDNQPSGS